MNKEELSGVPINRRLAVVNSVSSVVAFGTNISILFWVQQYLIKRVPGGEYALVPVVGGVMVFVPLFSTMLTVAAGRYLTQACAQKDPHRVTEIISSLFPLLLGAALLVLSVGGLFVYHVDSWLAVPLHLVRTCQQMLLLMLAMATANILTFPFIIGLYVKQRLVLSSLINAGGDLLRCVFLLVLLLGVEARVIWVVVATVLAQIIAVFVRMAFCRGLVEGLRFQRSAMRLAVTLELLGFGFWVFMMRLAATIRLGLTPLILLNYAGPIQTGSYHVGSLIAVYSARLVNLGIRPLEPPLVAMHTRGDQDGLRAAFMNAGRYALWLATAIAAPFVVFGSEFVQLYLGEAKNNTIDLEAVGEVLGYTLLALPLSFAGILLGPIARATGQVRSLGIRNSVYEAASLSLAVLLICNFQMGASGAALAPLLVAAFAMPLLIWPLAHRLAQVSYGTWLRRSLLPGLLPAFPAVGAWLLAKYWLQPDSLLSLVACAIPGSLVFALTAYHFCLQENEKRDVWRLLRKGF